ncbi:Uncharacterized protein SCF082_LOCUS15498 [Durusdinium trenchii]|uniref:Uncharacterized protein n=1 Tax=Durusdinium trenchii TaxID=1381693 RepID=A0ABP0K4U5_9DINO
MPTTQAHVGRSWIVRVCGVAAIAACTWLGTQTWGFDDEAPSEAAPAIGLRTVLPNEVPDSLDPADLDDILATASEDWQKKGNEIVELVIKLYEGDLPSVEAQEEVIGELKTKLSAVERALNGTLSDENKEALGELYGRLAPRVRLADAVLDTLTMDEEEARATRLSAAYSKLDDALDGPEEASEVVASVLAKLQSRGSYSDELQEFTSRASFRSLEDALADVSRAFTAEYSPQDQATLVQVLVDLVEAVESFEEEPTKAGSQAIRATYRRIRDVAPDGGARLTAALRADQFNYNLFIVASEGLLRRLLDESRRESSVVRDQVMEAYVAGNQWTTTRVSVDLKPNRNTARFLLKVSGHVQANTRGYTSEATISTVGYHTFNASKAVSFDGHVFSTEPARVGVNANNRTVGATTKYSGLPLFGRIADNIAYKEAVSRTGQANAYTSRRISSELSGRLNRETDSEFAKASMKLEERYGVLREYGLYPDAMQFSSTETQLRIQARLMQDDELGGTRALPGMKSPSDGVLIHVHDSLLTNSVERLDLAGKTMTESEVRALLEERLTKLLDREVDLPEPEAEEGEEPSDNTLVFDAEDPVRFDIEEGMLKIIIRAGLQRENAEPIPTQVITVPLKFSIADGQIVVTRDNVGVKPVERPSSVAEQIARANVMRQNIQRALPERSFDATLELEQGNRRVHLTVRNITARNHWLTIQAR